MVFRYGMFVGMVYSSTDTGSGAWAVAYGDEMQVLRQDAHGYVWRNRHGGQFNIVCPD